MEPSWPHCLSSLCQVLILLAVPRLVSSFFQFPLNGLVESSKVGNMPLCSSNAKGDPGRSTTAGEAGTRAEEQHADMITILGFGSLLSEASCRMTFPTLCNFRLGRVPNYRRVFAHPASIFFQRGIADLSTLQMSSLSVEYDEGNPGFVVSVFEIPNDGMMQDDGVPSQAFLEREEEFDIVQVPFEALPTLSATSSTTSSGAQLGVICTCSTDQAYVNRWGQERFDNNYGKYGIDTIWGYGRDSGLRPCAVYLRHCYLAAKSMGPVCLESFLDQTYLVDRVTTVRDYLEKHPEVLDTRPPRELEGRYSG